MIAVTSKRLLNQGRIMNVPLRGELLEQGLRVDA